LVDILLIILHRTHKPLAAPPTKSYWAKTLHFDPQLTL